VLSSQALGVGGSNVRAITKERSRLRVLPAEVSEKAAKFPFLTVRNLQRRAALDLEGLQSFSDRALQLCSKIRGKNPLSQLPRIDVLLISDRRMAALHRRFLQLAGPTDVITFQHGEIFVSVETAKRNAARFRTSVDAEVRLYILHGMLHLLGYDDTTPGARRKMMQKQKDILASAAASSRY